MMSNELQSIADSEHRHAKSENCGVGSRCIGIVDRAGTAGENQAHRFLRANLFDGGSAGQHHGKDVLFADATRYELCVLGAEVEDDDRGSVHGIVYLTRMASCVVGAFPGTAYARHSWMKATSRTT